jgi:DNA polymerase-3 subunit delta'
VEQIGNEWASRILEEKDLSKAPDLIVLRPENKTLGIDAIRELRRWVYQSPLQSHRKVVLVQEADRLNLAAANALLKTLEEPPDNTHLFLMTLRPYALPATLRSRCWWVSLPPKTSTTAIQSPQWEKWREDFKRWLADAVHPDPSPDTLLLQAYGLLYRLRILRLRETGSDTPNETEKSGIKTSPEGSFTPFLFTSLEEAVRDVWIQKWTYGPRFDRIIRQLEKEYRGTEVHLSEDSALESVFLKILDS